MNTNSSHIPKHKNLLRSIMEIMVGRASVSVFSLLFLAYFARELPKPVLGLVGVHAAIVVFSRILINLGLHFQVIREATPLIDQKRNGEAIDRVIGPATLIRLVAAIGITGILLIVGYVFLDRLQEAVPQLDMQIVLPFACAHILLKNSQYILGPIFHAHQRYWLDSVLDSGSGTSEKLFALIFYLTMGGDYFFTGIMVGESVTLILALWFLRNIIRKIRFHHLSFTDARQRLKEYFPHYQRLIYRRGFRHLDRVIIASLLPLSEMANYHVARQGAGMLGALTRIMTDPLTVRLSANLGAESEQHDRRLFYTLMIVFSLLVTCLSPWLIRVIGGDEYSTAWVMMALLSIGFMFNGLAEYQLAIIVVLSKTKISVNWEAIASIVGIATTVVMVHLLGEQGAPLGRLVNFFILYFLGRSVVRRIFSDRYS